MTEQHPPRFVSDLQPITAMDSDQVTMSTIVVGNPVPEITWFHDNRPITRDSDFSLTYNKDTGVAELFIIECFTEDTGVFKCVARNAVGESSTSAKLTVIEPTDFMKDVSDTDVSMAEVFVSEENLSHPEVMLQPKPATDEPVQFQSHPSAFAPPKKPPENAIRVEPRVATETRLSVDNYSDAAFLKVPVVRKTKQKQRRSQEAMHSETESEVETLDLMPVKRQSPPKAKAPRYQETIIKEKKPQPVEFQFQFSQPAPQTQSSYTETESEMSEPHPYTNEYSRKTTSHRVYRRSSVPVKPVEIPVDHYHPTVRTEVTRYIVAEPEDQPIWHSEKTTRRSSSTDRRHSTTRASSTMKIEEIYESDVPYDSHDYYESSRYDTRGRSRPIRVKRYFVEVPADGEEYMDFEDGMCSDTETVEETTKRRIIEETTTTRRRSSTRRYYPGYFSDSEVFHIRRAAPKRKHKVRVIHYIPVVPTETVEHVRVVRNIPVNAQRPTRMSSSSRSSETKKLTTVVTNVPVQVIKTNRRTEIDQTDTSEQNRKEITEKKRRISTPSKEVTRTRVEKQILVQTPCTSTEVLNKEEEETKEETKTTTDKQSHEDTEVKVKRETKTDVSEKTTVDRKESTTVRRTSEVTTMTPPIPTAM